jgi:DNA (cytosine-5)-methyltransferase 1
MRAEIDGLIIDTFAGGGGASEGIRAALGRGPDVAINHDADAVGLHAATHPETLHYCRNVWQCDPYEVVRECGRGKRVALLWASPDCKHFSKAKGAKPVKRSIRDLAWTVVLWAKRARPEVIILENVEEFRDWGPLVDAGGGLWRPCPEREGETFTRWVADLKRVGYRVDWRELRACDYGAPTIRKRLFVIARCDARPIVWPEPTHGRPDHSDVIAGRLQPWRTAAECIDWSLPTPSIFLTREDGRAIGVKRPLEDATMRRIAAGVMKFVVTAAKPFIAPITHSGGAGRVHALVSAFLTGCGGRAGQSPPRPMDAPWSTLTTKADGVLVPAFLAQHNGGVIGRRADDPLSTVTTTGSQQQLVLAFLTKYNGTAVGQDVGEPLHTCTTHARAGLVTVRIEGETYAIGDIGMRMLTPRELFRAQGFPDSYIIDRTADGRALTKTAQIRLCGNSVCPPIAAALVRANVGAAARSVAA